MAKGTRSMTGMASSTPTNSLSGCWPMSSNQVGKAVSALPTERPSMSMKARPRMPMRPASVTTSEGRPTMATQNPLKSPMPRPASRARMMPSSMGRPASQTTATMTEASPMTEATERSISPLMMTKVMASTTMARSMLIHHRLTWFWLPA